MADFREEREEGFLVVQDTAIAASRGFYKDRASAEKVAQRLLIELIPTLVIAATRFSNERSIGLQRQIKA